MFWLEKFYTWCDRKEHVFKMTWWISQKYSKNQTHKLITFVWFFSDFFLCSFLSKIQQNFDWLFLNDRDTGYKYTYRCVYMCLLFYEKYYHAHPFHFKRLIYLMTMAVKTQSTHYFILFFFSYWLLSFFYSF